ncbi:protein piccolo [Drosophila sechellia]|uniref:protein piccolo n=1 Tax=Drosophila sechellia TaxID=7238 RepID=UPI0013DE3654|nr:protein piccolo [Drosophila sechellia]
MTNPLSNPNVNRQVSANPRAHVDESLHVHGRVRNLLLASRPIYRQPNLVTVAALCLPLYSEPGDQNTTPARFGDTQGFYRNGCWYNGQLNQEPPSTNNQQFYLLAYLPSITNVQPVQMIWHVAPTQGSPPPPPQPRCWLPPTPPPPPPPPQFVLNGLPVPVNYIMGAQPQSPVYAQNPQAQAMYAMQRATVPPIPPVQTLPQQAPSSNRPIQALAPMMVSRGVQVPPRRRRPSFRHPSQQNPAPPTIDHAPSRMHLPGAGGRNLASQNPGQSDPAPSQMHSPGAGGQNLPSQNPSKHRQSPLTRGKGQSDPAPSQMHSPRAGGHNHPSQNPSKHRPSPPTRGKGQSDHVLSRMHSPGAGGLNFPSQNPGQSDPAPSQMHSPRAGGHNHPSQNPSKHRPSPPTRGKGQSDHVLSRMHSPGAGGRNFPSQNPGQSDPAPSRMHSPRAVGHNHPSQNPSKHRPSPPTRGKGQSDPVLSRMHSPGAGGRNLPSQNPGQCDPAPSRMHSPGAGGRNLAFQNPGQSDPAPSRMHSPCAGGHNLPSQNPSKHRPSPSTRGKGQSDPAPSQMHSPGAGGRNLASQNPGQSDPAPSQMHSPGAGGRNLPSQNPGQSDPAPSRMHSPRAGGHNLPSQNPSKHRPSPSTRGKGQSDPAPSQMHSPGTGGRNLASQNPGQSDPAPSRMHSPGAGGRNLASQNPGQSDPAPSRMHSPGAGGRNLASQNPGQSDPVLSRMHSPGAGGRNLPSQNPGQCDPAPSRMHSPGAGGRNLAFQNPGQSDPAPSRMHSPCAGGHNLPSQNPSKHRPSPSTRGKGQSDPAPSQMHSPGAGGRNLASQNPGQSDPAPSQMHSPGAGRHNLPSQNLSTHRPSSPTRGKGQSDPAPVRSDPAPNVQAMVEPEVAVAGSGLNGPSGTIDARPLTSDHPAQAVTVVERKQYSYESDISMEDLFIKAVQNHMPQSHLVPAVMVAQPDNVVVNDNTNCTPMPVNPPPTGASNVAVAHENDSNSIPNSVLVHCANADEFEKPQMEIVNSSDVNQQVVMPTNQPESPKLKLKNMQQSKIQSADTTPEAKTEEAPTITAHPEPIDEAHAINSLPEQVPKPTDTSASRPPVKEAMLDAICANMKALRISASPKSNIPRNPKVNMNHWPPLESSIRKKKAAKKDNAQLKRRFPKLVTVISFNSNDRPPKSHTAAQERQLAANSDRQSGLVNSSNSHANNHMMRQKSGGQKTPETDSKRRSMATEKRNYDPPSMDTKKRSYDQVMEQNPQRNLVLRNNSPRSPAASQSVPVVVEKRNIPDNVSKPPVVKKPLRPNNVQPKKPLDELKTLGSNMFDLLVEPDMEDDNDENTFEQDKPDADDVSPPKRSNSQKEKRRFKKQKTALEKQIKLTKLAEKEAKRVEKAKEKAKNANAENALAAIQSNQTQSANESVSGGTLGNFAQETIFFHQLPDVVGTPPPSQPRSCPSPSVARSEVNSKQRTMKKPTKLSTFLAAVTNATLKKKTQAGINKDLPTQTCTDPAAGVPLRSNASDAELKLAMPVSKPDAGVPLRSNASDAVLKLKMPVSKPAARVPLRSNASDAELKLAMPVSKPDAGVPLRSNASDAELKLAMPVSKPAAVAPLRSNPSNAVIKLKIPLSKPAAGVPLRSSASDAELKLAMPVSKPDAGVPLRSNASDAVLKLAMPVSKPAAVAPLRSNPSNAVIKLKIPLSKPAAGVPLRSYATDPIFKATNPISDPLAQPSLLLPHRVSKATSMTKDNFERNRDVVRSSRSPPSLKIDMTKRNADKLATASSSSSGTAPAHPQNNSWKFDVRPGKVVSLPLLKNAEDPNRGEIQEPIVTSEPGQNPPEESTTRIHRKPQED